MLQGIASFALALALVGAVATTAKGQDSGELTRTLDAWHAAGQAGEIDKWLAVRTAEVRKDMPPEMLSPKHRKQAAMFARIQAAESYEVQHVAWGKDGRSATLYIVARFTAMPEAERPAGRAEESIAFKKEGGTWKIDIVRPLADPDKIKRPADLSYDPENANENRSGNLGGRIVKTEFKPNYTLVIVRVMDEEDAVFLPPKDVIAKAGETAETLAPWKLHEFDGHPHKTDPLKFFATGGKPLAEE
jgi:hypothetical protein